MKLTSRVVVFGTVALAAAMAQSPTRDAMPIGATRFVCHWGTEPGRGTAYVIENGSMATEQTGDKWTILQNNQFGFVAAQSMSEFVPRLNKKVVAFWMLAIDRTNGKGVMATGDTERPGAFEQGTCTGQS